jgi:four helix bundle protein
MSINSYRDLVAWQRSRVLIKVTYDLTRLFPPEEKFGLTSQMRRAAVGVLSNIAEGYGRNSQQDYLQFLRITRGSLFELEAQSLAAMDLEFLAAEGQAALQEAINEVAKPLSGLIRSLE